MGNFAGTCRTLMCSLQVLTGTRRDGSQQHQFLDAAKAGNFAEVRRMLEEKPDLVNCQPNGRWSALHHAAHKGNLAAVQSLLERGASLTLKTREGLTPVEVASSSIFDHLLYLSLQASEAEEAKGKCSKRCASEEVLRTLTLWRFSPSNLPAGVCLSEEDSQCLICLEDFKEEEELRTLHCCHSFHARCVDGWLTEKSRCCPTCRADCAEAN
ncbi:unnamed protein product [Effrenium voratum]|uniref:RING-type domain-containing protein n=1 Tax=Effrenium voratum TaxID=2562239 RepID=A0AA36MUN0_9DINO|nr:unnamed protein product [Effrenium voratum]